MSADVQPEMFESNPGLVRMFPPLGARHLQVWLVVLQVEPAPYEAVQSLLTEHCTHVPLAQRGVGAEQFESAAH